MQKPPGKNHNRRESNIDTPDKFRQASSLLIVMLLAVLTGCSMDESLTPLEPESSTVNSDITTPLAKRSDRTFLSYLEALPDGDEYPQLGSCTADYLKRYQIYEGSACLLSNESAFYFLPGALTPPPGHPEGKPVTITMMAEKDPVTSEIIYSFGPSGCTFDKPAEVWLTWHDLGSPNATLYYLAEDGTRQEQSPEQIDIYNKAMCIRIAHFSRYALAYSN